MSSAMHLIMAAQDRLFRTGDFLKSLDDFSLPLPVYYGDRLVVIRGRDELRNAIDLYRYDVIGGEKPFITCAAGASLEDAKGGGIAELIWTMINLTGAVKTIIVRYFFGVVDGAPKIVMLQLGAEAEAPVAPTGAIATAEG